MEHESFENEEIARLMNENFVNIKVDREERPDLDQIYMTAVQMMTGQGGWPMTMFLTPEGVPFYGGTYFPPDDRFNMPGFPRVLLSVAEAYRSQREQVGNTATQMLGELRRVGLAAESRDLLTTEILDGAYRRIAKNYDQVNGGFGGAPKFPPAMTLEFFLHTCHRTHDDDALKMVTETCREMTDSRGGFYSSQDADSEGVEGKFFVWSREEVIAALGESDGAIFCDYFDISDQGNFEGHNILHVNATIDDVARRYNIDVASV